jgi:hypothetical protein
VCGGEASRTRQAFARFLHKGNKTIAVLYHHPPTHTHSPPLARQSIAYLFSSSRAAVQSFQFCSVLQNKAAQFGLFREFGCRFLPPEGVGIGARHFVVGLFARPQLCILTALAYYLHTLWDVYEFEKAGWSPHWVVRVGSMKETISGYLNADRTSWTPHPCVEKLGFRYET